MLPKIVSWGRVGHQPIGIQLPRVVAAGLMPTLCRCGNGNDEQ